MSKRKRVILDDSKYDLSPLLNFDAIVSKFSNNIALYTEGRYYTYLELYQHVKKIKLYIQEQNLTNTVIAFSSSSSVWMFASVLAIMQSGNSLLPFNQEHPIQRIHEIFEKINPSLVFVFDQNKQLQLQLKNYKSCLVPEMEVLQTEKQGRALTQLSGIAYILFTSGSTGSPKGVPVSNKNLNHLLQFFTNTSEYDFNSQDRFLQVYEPTFDVFYFSLLVPLLKGATCYITPSEKGKPRYLNIPAMLNQHNITVLSMVPVILQYLNKYLDELQFLSLRYSFFSGDALFNSLAVRWKKCIPNGVIHNFYGPTETTIVCTRYIWENQQASQESQNDIVPLGVPFPGMDYVIVDEDNKPVEVGQTGELCFEGVQVIEGYINGEHKHLFLNRSMNQTNRSYYKTGDLVFLNHHSNLIFKGRKDYQCKINGYRVELQEIEERLMKITNGRVAVISKRMNNRLNAIFAFTDSHSLSEQEIVTELKKKLPDYMIPQRIFYVDPMPLNTNNKIDKQQLLQLILDYENDKRTNN